MAEVKWIKIATGVFDDDAFQIIDDLPERDAIELIWFKLLVLAGKQNNHGLFLFKDTLPYTDEMLSSIFHRPVNTVRLAMETFKNLKMIDVIEDVYAIPNWDKYQSLDALDKKKERDREYQKKIREKQRLELEEKKSSDNRLTSDDSSYSISISNSNSLSTSFKEEIVNIVNYLNTVLGTNYKCNSKNTVKHITARLNEGYTEEDFFNVIDKKVNEWNGTEMEKYLVPDTLFGTKFEKYLNQNVTKSKGRKSELDEWASV